MIVSHLSGKYAILQAMSGPNRHNGAYYYSVEILRNIIPNIKTDRNWVTINTGECFDNSIVFIHNNMDPWRYDWMKKYNDLVLVCGIPETVEKVQHLGRAVYLPLSVDVQEVQAYAKPKTKDAAFVGRAGKRKGLELPDGIDIIENLPRPELLAAMAEYETVYAVGRVAIEALVLGCEIKPYDPRFPDPSRWRVLDNKDAAVMLQKMIDEIDGAKI